MSRINTFFNELDDELLKVVLLDTFINAVLIFLAANIILLFFRQPYYYAIIIGGVFFVVSSIMKFRRIQLNIVEQKNPVFKDMLRTAKDNIESTSIMAMALFQEIIDKSNKLLVGNLMNYKGLFWRTILILVLVAGSGFAANYNYQQLKLESLIDRYDFEFVRNPFSINSDKGLTESDDIYGISSLAKLGTEELEFELNSGISQLDLTNLKEEEQVDSFSSEGKAVNVKGVGAAASTETSIMEDLEIVKAFNKKRLALAR